MIIKIFKIDSITGGSGYIGSSLAMYLSRDITNILRQKR